MKFAALVIGISLAGGMATYLIIGPRESGIIEPVAMMQGMQAMHRNFADGTYSASVTYLVPSNHEEPLTVILDIKDGNITASKIETDPTNGTSRLYLGRFSDWHGDQVVGQPLRSLSLSRVGGASLTSEAFNQALESIKNQAHK